MVWADGEAASSVRYWLGARLGEADREAGGVVLRSVPVESESSRLGLRERDVILSVNETSTSSVEAFVQTLSSVGPGPLDLALLREGEEVELWVSPSRYVMVETSHAARELKEIPLPSRPIANALLAYPETFVDPLETLSDCRLNKALGPVIGNDVFTGAYKMDLGAVKPVFSVSSWSSGKHWRGRQSVMVYGSDSKEDPGWDLEGLTPLGCWDTGGGEESVFVAASLRSVSGETLGDYRWIVWAVSPIQFPERALNTSFQELSVECAQ